jgi:hypothetical protein
MLHLRRAAVQRKEFHETAPYRSHRSGGPRRVGIRRDAGLFRHRRCRGRGTSDARRRHFAKPGKQEVRVKVAKVGAMGPEHGSMGTHDMSHMDMMKH